ncbi:uncharacterized protein LOC115396793 isoform X3 [Salarias fasciatus]|uniref:uncharacterized protein LOC115396793 isoform X3 n=1 Tax=Salarias fasciatus TaxID=181472 RepID=UPI001176652E|nr:uncharacterized protein LOC115396793 isoform X3 [Salarias fasciatus]
MAPFEVPGLLLMVQIIVSSECSDIQTVATHEAVTLFRLNSDEIDARSRFKVIKYTSDKKTMVISEWPKQDQTAKRMSWEPDGNGLVCLHLKNVQKSDEGTYSCEMWRGWDRVRVRNMTLKVKDCKTFPAVKAKPDSSFRLQCSVDITPEKQRPQNVSWAKLKGLHHEPVDSQRVGTDNTLIIQTVSYSDSGWYRCNYVLGKTKRCVDVRLNVQGNPYHYKMLHLVLSRTANINISQFPEEADDTSEATTATTIPNTPTHTLQGSHFANLITLLVPVTFGLVTATILGLFFYCRQRRRTVPKQHQIAGISIEFLENYLNLIPSHSQGPDLPVSSQSSCIRLQENCDGERMQTCEC